MIETRHGTAPWTTDEAAAAIGCCRSNTSRKLVSLADRIVKAALADPTLWATTGRPDRAARGFTEFVITAGALAAGDPARFQLWIRQMLERNGNGNGKKNRRHQETQQPH